MSQGIYIRGHRPRSKKEIREAAASNPSLISVEATSFFGNEFNGPAVEAPVGKTIYFVGPDPQVSRKFYGTLVNKGDGQVVVR